MKDLILFGRHLKDSKSELAMRDGTVGASGGLFMLILAATGLLLTGCASGAPKHSGVLRVSTEMCPYQIQTLDRGELTFADGSSKELIVTHEGTVDVTSGPQKV